MEIRNRQINELSIGRILSVGLMIFCLTFLTSLNYFIHSSGEQSSVNISGFNTEETENDFPAPGPTEEKSGSSGFSISEEILHELHADHNFEASNQLYLHHIAEAEKIEMFHPELILPPPKS